MKNKEYPTVVIDNFFKNPELIREFALSLPFEKSPDGRWPGERSPMLNEIDEELVKNIAAKILSIYFDLKTRVYWDDIQMTFQKTRQYSNEKDSPQNKGWIHIDEDKCFAGVIYLTPDINLETGTSIYKLKDTHQNYNVNEGQEEKFNLYKDGIYNKKEYDKQILDLHDKFELVTDVKNVYNRLILYDSNQYHSGSSYYSEGKDRLSLVFFFTNVRGNVYPYEKIMNFDDEIEGIINENTISQGKGKKIATMVS